MTKHVRLSDMVVAIVEGEQQSRETYSDTIERLLKELGRYRKLVTIHEVEGRPDLARITPNAPLLGEGKC